LLRSIRDAQPDVPIKLLSAQAEGADLLVAEVARELGIGIIALLPHGIAQCRADLTSDAVRAAFDRTMAGAEILELKPVTNAGTGDPPRLEDARDRQFERAGDLIALHSSLMIAIWDGMETAHRAGTARSVKRRSGRTGSGIDGQYALPDRLSFAADNDLMYEIRCSRLSTVAAGTSGAGVNIVGFMTGKTTFGSVAQGIPPPLAVLLARTAEFNRDARKYGTRIVQQGRPLASAESYPVSDALLYLNDLFATADWLAVHFRRSFTRALASRFSLWALLTYFLLAFKKSPDGISGFMLIVAVLLVFGLSWMLSFWARRRSWDRRGLDYRALAEGLRVDFYWELAGVRARFDDAFAHEGFLHKYAELEWMRAAMRTVNLRCALYSRATTPNGFEFALSAWVGDPDRASDPGQLHYYRRTAAKLKRRLAIAEHISRAMLVGGLLIAVMLAGDVALRLFDHSAVLAPAPRGLMLTALALLTAYTAIFEIYLAEKSDRTLVRQYHHMDSLFTRAAHELRSARRPADKLGILRALGHACLAEHAQWILSHRDKRIDGLRW